MDMYVPNRCDVFYLNLHPQAGKEMSKLRPVVVLSPEEYNQKTSLAVICPITNQQKGYPFEIEIPKGYPVQGVILADHIKSLDWRTSGGDFICTLPSEVIDDVVAKICALIE
jgi:mRNA interferase MazF